MCKKVSQKYHLSIKVIEINVVEYAYRGTATLNKKKQKCAIVLKAWVSVTNGKY